MAIYYYAPGGTCWLSNTQESSSWQELVVGSTVVLTRLVKVIDTLDKLVLPESCDGLFKNGQNAEYIETEKFDTSAVTSAVSMFEGCSKLDHLNFLGGDVSHILDFRHFCQNTSSLRYFDMTRLSVNFSPFVTLKTAYMFSGCSNLEFIYVNRDYNYGVGIISTVVEDHIGMFQSCVKLPNYAGGPLEEDYKYAKENGGYLSVPETATIFKEDNAGKMGIKYYTKVNGNGVQVTVYRKIHGFGYRAIEN